MISQKDRIESYKNQIVELNAYIDCIWAYVVDHAGIDIFQLNLEPTTEQIELKKITMMQEGEI
jgi:hypothetical protein